MLGNVNSQGVVADNEGLIPRCFTNLFRQLQERECEMSIELEMNFVELYMERLQDLLYRPDPSMAKRRAAGSGAGVTQGAWRDDADMKIRALPDGTTQLTECTAVKVDSMADAMFVVQRGLQVRTTAATKSNQQSSRSHAILILTLKTQNLETQVKRSSQLYFVDLAGSEKVSKTEAEGMRLDEAKVINLSLFTLGQVVSALSMKRKPGQPKPHIPYRDSKLSRLLENSLGGNALTFLVVTCSPNSYNAQETLSTLRFGSKAQEIATRPVKNEFRTVPELEFLLAKQREEIELQKSEIALLRNQLKSHAATQRNAVAHKLGKGHALMNTVIENRCSGVLTSVGMCPLTQRQMRDPVLAMDGFTYERRAITAYLQNEAKRPHQPNDGNAHQRLAADSQPRGEVPV